MDENLTKNRYIAKAIDLFSMGGFMTLGDFLTGSVFIGFFCGTAYILLGDATGATWKNNFGMRAVDAATGAACSVRQSVLRNAPWILAPAIKVLAQQLFEPDMVEARALRGVAGLLGLTLTVLMVGGLRKSGRHLGDLLADTVVQPTPQKDATT